MYASDMMGDHTIEHCQSLLLLSVLMVSCPFVHRKRADGRTTVIGQKRHGLSWVV
jgi:hypothetical protein